MTVPCSVQFGILTKTEFTLDVFEVALKLLMSLQENLLDGIRCLVKLQF